MVSKAFIHHPLDPANLSLPRILVSQKAPLSPITTPSSLHLEHSPSSLFLHTASLLPFTPHTVSLLGKSLMFSRIALLSEWCNDHLLVSVHKQKAFWVRTWASLSQHPAPAALWDTVLTFSNELGWKRAPIPFIFLKGSLEKQYVILPCKTPAFNSLRYCAACLPEMPRITQIFPAILEQYKEQPILQMRKQGK